MGKFYVDGIYSAFEELMHYYHYDFYVYYFLTIMVFVNCIKAIVNFISVNNSKTSPVIVSYIDLIISILAGMGLMGGLFFHGILTDISAKWSEIYFNKMFAACIVAFVLFIIQVFFTAKIKSIKNKNISINE